MDDITTLEGELLVILSTLKDSTFRSCCERLQILDIRTNVAVQLLANLIIAELTERPSVLPLMVRLAITLGQDIGATVQSTSQGTVSSPLIDILRDLVCHNITETKKQFESELLLNFKAELEQSAKRTHQHKSSPTQDSDPVLHPPIVQWTKTQAKAEAEVKDDKKTITKKVINAERGLPNSSCSWAVPVEPSPIYFELAQPLPYVTQPRVHSTTPTHNSESDLDSSKPAPMTVFSAAAFVPSKRAKKKGENMRSFKGKPSKITTRYPLSTNPHPSSSLAKEQTLLAERIVGHIQPSLSEPLPSATAFSQDISTLFGSHYSAASTHDVVDATAGHPAASVAAASAAAASTAAVCQDDSDLGIWGNMTFERSKSPNTTPVDLYDQWVESYRSREIEDFAKIPSQNWITFIHSPRFIEILKCGDLTDQESHNILHFLHGIEKRRKPDLYSMIMKDGSPMSKFLKQVVSPYMEPDETIVLPLLQVLYHLHQGLFYSLDHSQRHQYTNMYHDSLDIAYRALRRLPSGKGEQLADKFYILKTAKGFQMQSFENQTLQNMSARPEMADIMGPVPKLVGNRKVGEYPSTSTYLDTHFKLLREDFVHGLRQGVEDYRNWRKKCRNTTSDIHFKSSDVNLYRDVMISPREHSGRDENHHKPTTIYTKELALSQQCPVSQRILRMKNTKHLMHGALVCLSDDDFCQRLLLAVVRDVKQLGEFPFGKVCVTVDFAPQSHVDLMFSKLEKIDRVKKKDDNDDPQSYNMLETRAFYEAYIHVLEALKSFARPNQILPFQNYIVQCVTEVKPPNYLAKNRVKLRTCAKADLKPLDKITKLSSWPTASTLQLNASQYRAFQQALTKEFVLIQGPPGTGKTYVGLQIMRTLVGLKKDLGNRLEGPILIVCYTNHALDQFLEGILTFEPSLIEPKDVLRVGSQSKSSIIEDAGISLGDKFRDPRNRLSKQDRSEAKRSADRKREELKGYRYKLRFGDYEGILLSTRRIVMPHTLLLTDDTVKSLPQLIRKIPVANRNKLMELFDEFAMQNGCEIMEEAMLYWLMPTYGSWMEVYKEGAFKYVPRLRDADDGFEMEEETLNLFEEFVKRGNLNPMSFEEVNKIVLDLIQGNTTLKRMYEEDGGYYYDDINATRKRKQFSFTRGWRFYCFFAEQFRIQLKEAAARKLKYYDQLYNSWEESNRKERVVVMKNMTVIGMTTTRAASEQKSLMEIGPPIVIVEEAAEVLESHIVGALSPKCKHLILIGDHQQLRPSTATHRLTQEPFHLDISLFERMVKNHVENVQLKVQHRMRPEISQFVRFIYPDIADDESVKGREGIRGFTKPVWMLNHNHKESVHSGTNSKVNEKEADMLVALCKYLLDNQYEADQITIITMYAGQLLAIRNKMQRVPVLVDDGRLKISVRTVDDYQGEENHIIILSLVRSERAGFTAEAERICVAMSRAKYGLFVLGNLQKLAGINALWRKIYNKAQEKGMIDGCFHLACPRHDKVFRALNREDFDNFLKKKCSEPCLLSTECGHPCDRKCHNEKAHAKTKCKAPCTRWLRCGHLCQEKCSDPCTTACRAPKKITFTQTTSGCTHTINALCHQKPATRGDLQRIEKCQKIDAICTANPYNYNPTDGTTTLVHYCLFVGLGVCPAYCTDIAYGVICDRCGKNSQVQCALRYMAVQHCTSRCNQPLECGHNCPGTCGSCHNEQKHAPCSAICGQPLKCGHLCTSICGTCFANGVHGSCNGKCREQLECGHICPGSCKDHLCKIDMHQQSACKELCSSELSCGHNCRAPCGTCRRSTPISHITCEQICRFERESCPHRCNYVCHNLPLKEQTIHKSNGDTRTERFCPADAETRCCARNGDEMSPCGHIIRRLCHQKLLSNELKEHLADWSDLLSRSCLVPENLHTIGQQRCSETHLCLVACKKKVSMKCPRCSTAVTIACYQEGLIDPCPAECSLDHPCGHRCTGSCSACKDGNHVVCKYPCPVILKCGHRCPGNCNDNECQLGVHKPCAKICEAILECGHACNSQDNCVTCAEDGHAPCKVSCGRPLPCSTFTKSHQCKQECHQKPMSEDGTCPDPGVCFEMVSKTAACSHLVEVKCHQEVWNFKVHGLEQLTINGPCNTAATQSPNHCNNLMAGRACFSLCRILNTKTCLKCNITKSTKDLCHKVITECSSPCKTMLPCGHQCPGSCQICSKEGHQSCVEKCSRVLECNHVCPSKSCLECFERGKHQKCIAPCHKQKECGHKCQAICHTEDQPHEQGCTDPCSRQCSHNYDCGSKCSEACTFPTCPFECNEVLFCGHKCRRKGHKCERLGEHETCKQKCGQELPCGHSCAGKCHICCQDSDTIRHTVCKTVCDVLLDKCGHRCTRICSKCTSSDSHEICRKPCEDKHQCGHKCEGKCGECVSAGYHPVCTSKCSSTLECGHKCVGQCEKCLDGHMKCEAICKKCQDCGHVCAGVCGECSEMGENMHIACQKKCGSVLDCTHQCRGICSSCRETGKHAQCEDTCKAELACQPGHKCKGKCGECKLNGHPPCGNKCTFKLPCQHTCAGKSCSKCFTDGHPPCEGKVESSASWKSESNGFVCGHKASQEVTCGEDKNLHVMMKKSKACKAPCILRCSHGVKCKAECGDICDFGVEHNEKCNCKWGCECSPCKNTCRQPCTHLPCKKPCKLKKNCKKCKKMMECHSLCGMPCVMACNTCSSDNYSNYKEMGEVVSLPWDCGHIVALSDIKFWSEKTKDNTNREITIKVSTPFCPECHSPILNNGYFIAMARATKWDEEQSYHKSQQRIQENRSNKSANKTAPLKPPSKPLTPTAQNIPMVQNLPVTPVTSTIPKPSPFLQTRKPANSSLNIFSIVPRGQATGSLINEDLFEADILDLAMDEYVPQPDGANYATGIESSLPIPHSQSPIPHSQLPNQSPPNNWLGNGEICDVSTRGASFQPQTSLDPNVQSQPINPKRSNGKSNQKLVYADFSIQLKGLL